MWHFEGLQGARKHAKSIKGTREHGQNYKVARELRIIPGKISMYRFSSIFISGLIEYLFCSWPYDCLKRVWIFATIA